jgi:hypothetical protein
LTRFSDSYTNSANYLKSDAFEEIKARPNMGDQTIQGNLSLDFQPQENIMITLGGNYNHITNRLGPSEDNGGDGSPNPNSYQNLFNFANNGKRVDQNYNGFLRFRQAFNNSGISDTGSLLKNVYYQVQYDYSRRKVESYDPRFYDRLNEINYVGKFAIDKEDILYPEQAPAFELPSTTVDANGNVTTTPIIINTTPETKFQLMSQPQGLSFTPSSINPDLAAINKQIFEENNIVSDLQLLGLTGFLNGGGGNDFGYFYPTLGKAQTGYSKSLSQQHRVSLQAGAEIKNHNIKVGFEFEQRIISSYNTIGSLYSRSRQQLNAQFVPGLNTTVLEKSLIANDDPANPDMDTLVKVYTSAFVNPFTKQNGLYPGQTTFDRNFRAKNGIPDNENILLDSYGPNTFSINDFGVSDILDNGNSPLSLWQGYTPYGRVAGKSSFFDFFKDTVNRPVDAFRPIYYAGFIEDKFVINDLVLRRNFIKEQEWLNRVLLEMTGQFM